MSAFPSDFDSHVAETFRLLECVDGWLTDREVQFLALVAACPTARGDILEIGAYRGRSTIVLARASKLAGPSRVITVDPLPDAGPMLAGSDGRLSAKALLEQNLRRAGVDDRVEIHKQYSQDFARCWPGRALRLLWLDGDERYEVVRHDIESFTPHLEDGAIVAMHDVLNASGERIRGFMELVLRSAHYGPAGVCGSIGWAKYRRDPQEAAPHEASKKTLYRRLAPLVPYHGADRVPRGLARLRYRVRRALVPHRNVAPQVWLRSVT